MSNVRAIDTSEGFEIVIGGADFDEGSRGVTLLAGGEQMTLTVNEANALADHLRNFAIEADRANLNLCRDDA